MWELWSLFLHFWMSTNQRILISNKLKKKTFQHTYTSTALHSLFFLPFSCRLQSHNSDPAYLWRTPGPCCSRAPAAAAPGWCCPPPRPWPTPCRHMTCGSGLWWNRREPCSAPAPAMASGRLAAPHRGRAAAGHRQGSWLFVHFWTFCGLDVQYCTNGSLVPFAHLALVWKFCFCILIHLVSECTTKRVLKMDGWVNLLDSFFQLLHSLFFVFVFSTGTAAAWFPNLGSINYIYFFYSILLKTSL